MMINAGHSEVAAPRGRPVGWIQCYAAVDLEDEGEHQQWFALGVARTAAGVDYLVGEAEDRGRGLGGTMIAAFVEEVILGRHPEWTQACASPQVANAAPGRRSCVPRCCS